MSPAVAEIISKACADARCTWELARHIAPLHRDGAIHAHTKRLVARYGPTSFRLAHEVCDMALLSGDFVGAWRE